MDRSAACARPIPLNATARLVLEVRRRATAPIAHADDCRDPLEAIIRCIEGAPGSRQSLAVVVLMTDIVRNTASPRSTPETLNEISAETASLIALFSERFEVEYRHDARLARFRRVKLHRPG
jgi:hypothetical protein